MCISLSLSIAISSSETARGRGEHAVTKHGGNIVTQCRWRIELTSLTNENHNGNCTGNKRCRLRTGTNEFRKLGTTYQCMWKGQAIRRFFLEGRRQTKSYNTIQPSPFLKLTSSDFSTLALLLVSHTCSSCRRAVYGGPRINVPGRVWKQVFRGDQSIVRRSFLLIWATAGRDWLKVGRKFLHQIFLDLLNDAFKLLHCQHLHFCLGGLIIERSNHSACILACGKVLIENCAGCRISERRCPRQILLIWLMSIQTHSRI